MDLHPIAVHFPIALLTVYTFVQLVPPRKLWKSEKLFTLAAATLLIGSIGALLAQQTGETAAENIKTALVETHETWANISVALYGILSAIYVLLIADRTLKSDRPVISPDLKEKTLGNPAYFIIRIARALFATGLVTILALLGVTALTITGALGGAIVHGPDIDPFVSTIHSLLVK